MQLYGALTLVEGASARYIVTNEDPPAPNRAAALLPLHLRTEALALAL